MRRPSHWMLLSIPLFVLYTRGEPAPLPLSGEPTPFAYVREDGTEIYLRYTGSAIPHPEMSEEDTRVDPEATGPDLRAAVYTWSTPVAAPTSGSTSRL